MEDKQHNQRKTQYVMKPGKPVQTEYAFNPLHPAHQYQLQKYCECRQQAGKPPKGEQLADALKAAKAAQAAAAAPAPTSDSLV